MRIDAITYRSPGNPDFDLPAMMKIQQRFPVTEITKIEEETRRQTEQLLMNLELDGKRIAVTAGSRKIANLVRILKTAVTVLREKGASPFILPAMGSHGGAAAEGQRGILRDLGITEETVGAPVISHMETEQIGTLPGGMAVYCSKDALEADGILVCGRIKPHTSIKGEVESGLCKMMVVGMGKHRGAAAFHRQGYYNLAGILLQAGTLILDQCNIIGALGILENAYDKTAKIEGILPGGLLKREAQLLREAKHLMPRFLMNRIDVLIVEQFGKEISGAGMDPNITGRAITPLPVETPVPIFAVVALDLTDISEGNATGIGGADITTRRVIEKINFYPTYTNLLTSGALAAGKLPLIFNNDEEAIRAAMMCAPGESPEKAKIVRIKDTLHLGEIWVSENYYEEILGIPEAEVLERNLRFDFDENGRLKSCYSPRNSGASPH